MAIQSTNSAAPRVPAAPYSLASLASVPTRRGVLSAIAGVPLVATVATAPILTMPVDRSAWQAAVARHLSAWKRLEDHPMHAMLANDPGYEAAEIDEAACCKAVSATEAAIRDLPAPDLDAVIEKLELHIRNYGEDSVGLVEAAVADIRRLVGREG